MSRYHTIYSERSMLTTDIEPSVVSNIPTTSVPVVRLEQMVQQAGLLRPEEDWTGLSDPKMRRRLQNRLNHRAWRRRQQDTLNSDASVETNPTITVPNWSPINGPDKMISRLCSSSFINIKARMAEFEQSAFYSYSSGSPRIDLLFNLTQFNVMRALFISMAAVGYSLNLFMDSSGNVSDSTISPLNTGGASPTIWSTPSHLQPTQLQLTVKHDPWIDLWPFPEMRDNILSCGEEYHDTELCIDLVENYCGPNGISGFRVWGDPWNPGNWEVSEEFVRKWGWVIFGCSELFMATDYWRQRRGERTISNSYRTHWTQPS